MARPTSIHPPLVSGPLERVRSHAERCRPLRLSDWLADSTRADSLALDAGPIHADFSRQRLDSQALQALHDWALVCGFDDARKRLFGGEAVNVTENRPALHTALRGVGGNPDIAATVKAQHARMNELAVRLRAGQLRGYSGEAIEALVCIGIGGSDLGPRMVCYALGSPHDFKVRFVANVDPDDLDRALTGLAPARTAFAVISKTFTTRETLANGDAARRWLQAGGCPADQLADHLIGVTAMPQAAWRWGIRPDLTLSFGEWVGGRFSLWSSVGLGIAVACGPEVFEALLAGAALVDRHFRDQPVATNLPARLGLISVWNRAFLGMSSQAVVPYAERLRLMPSWLQQLVMESNGKSAGLDGLAAALPSAPVVWGTCGTNAQHSYFQQLHQGPDPVPVDFVLVRRGPTTTDDDRHRILLANGLAQAAALAIGRHSTDGNLHRDFPGNRPSTLLVLPQLNAESLGALLACYEHATFTAATVLGINPFDQFGVELGKGVATTVERALAGGPSDDLDPATRAMIERLR